MQIVDKSHLGIGLSNDNPTKIERSIDENREAYLLYDGAPALDEDIADYYKGTIKAVKLA